MKWRYVSHGVTIESACPLPGHRDAQVHPIRGGSDVSVSFVDRPSTIWGEQLIASVEGELPLRIGASNGGFHMQFGEIATADLDTDGRTIDLWMAPEFEQVRPWLVMGAPLGMALVVQHRIVLHGSAVCHQGAATLLVAPSGRGKSSAAALACAGGMGLLAEDLVCIERGAAGWQVHRGGGLLRLRQPLPEVQRVFPGGAVSLSSDGRALVDVGIEADTVPLRRVCFVALDDTGSAVSMSPLDPGAALRGLLGAHRIAGLCDVSMVGEFFEAMSDLVRDVEVLRVAVPWRGGLDLDVARRLSDELCR